MQLQIDPIALCEKRLDADKLSAHFNDVLLANPYVKTMYENGFALTQIIIFLNWQIRQLQKKQSELDALIPRKYKLPSGRIVIWYPPQEFIPCENL